MQIAFASWSLSLSSCHLPSQLIDKIDDDAIGAPNKAIGPSRESTCDIFFSFS